MYADDTHLTYASNNTEDIECTLNRDLANVSDWLKANKLTLNKTDFMVIGSWQKLGTFDKSPNLVLDSFPIKQVSTTKSVGVLVDKHLSWNAPIASISKKNGFWYWCHKTLQAFCSHLNSKICL